MSQAVAAAVENQHPAPFPPVPPFPPNSELKALPPKPSLKGRLNKIGIVLSWTMSIKSTYADIKNYQLFAYQETPGPVSSTLWKKVGDVNPIPLPMACTLTQFAEGSRYYFTVRAVDVHMRCGPYSDAVCVKYYNIENALDSYGSGKTGKIQRIHKLRTKVMGRSCKF